MGDVGPGNAAGESLARLGRVGASGSLVGRDEADSPWTTVGGTALIRAFPPYHPDPSIHFIPNDPLNPSPSPTTSPKPSTPSLPTPTPRTRLQPTGCPLLEPVAAGRTERR